jgi:hypothetical protein
VDILNAPPRSGFAAMLQFYEHRRVARCTVDDDKDMLLFQWGTYDWGHGLNFELDLTRQVILPDEEDDDNAIWQLHLTYRFSPTEELRALKAGNRWCRTPADLPDFSQFVTGSDPYRLVADMAPRSIDVDYECAG